MEDGGLGTHLAIHQELEHNVKNVTFITIWAMVISLKTLIIVKFVKLHTH